MKRLILPCLSLSVMRWGWLRFWYGASRCVMCVSGWLFRLSVVVRWWLLMVLPACALLCFFALLCFGSWRSCFALVLGASVLLWFLALLFCFGSWRSSVGCWCGAFGDCIEPMNPTHLWWIFSNFIRPKLKNIGGVGQANDIIWICFNLGICQGITQYGLVWSCSNYVVWCYGIMRNHHQKDGTSISTTFWVPLTKWIGPKFGRTQNCSPCAITWGDLKTWSCHQKFAAGSQLLSKQDISLLGEKCWLSSQTKSPVGFLIEPQSMGMWRQIHF